MTKKLLPSLKEEKKLWREDFIVVGVDEVGRGALAGPIVAAAIAFAPQVKNLKSKIKNWGGRIDDSKKLSAKERNRAYQWLKKACLCWGIGKTTVSGINKMGIAKAYFAAARKAVFLIKDRMIDLGHQEKKLFVLADYYYINYLKGIGLKNQKAIVSGDEKCLSIAAASIMAKVERDKIMDKLSKNQPEYQWDKNKGYGTLKHRQAIKKHGITRLHRKLFVRNLVKI